jgi:hypothetical protein
MVAQRKHKKFQLDNETRGRRLKAEIFPEFKILWEEIFSHGSGGMVGGLESHARLTTDILYRSQDNNLYMRQSRDMLIKIVLQLQSLTRKKSILLNAIMLEKMFTHGFQLRKTKKLQTIQLFSQTFLCKRRQ